MSRYLHQFIGNTVNVDVVQPLKLFFSLYLKDVAASIYIKSKVRLDPVRLIIAFKSIFTHSALEASL